MIDRNCKYQIDYREGGWNYRLIIVPAQKYGDPPTTTKDINPLALGNIAEIASKFLDDKLPIGAQSSDSTKFKFDMRYVSPNLYNILINPLVLMDFTDYMGHGQFWDEAIKLTNVFQLYCDFGTGTLSQIFIGAQKPSLVTKYKITMESMICEVEVNYLAQTVLENIKSQYIIKDLYYYIVNTPNDIYGKPNYISSYRAIDLVWTESTHKRIIIQEPPYETNRHFASCNIFVSVLAFETILQRKIQKLAGLYARTTDTSGLTIDLNLFINGAFGQDAEGYLTDLNYDKVVDYKHCYFIGWKAKCYETSTYPITDVGTLETPPVPTTGGGSWDVSDNLNIQTGGFFAGNEFGLLNYANLWDFFKELAENNYQKLVFTSDDANAPFGIHFKLIKEPCTITPLQTISPYGSGSGSFEFDLDSGDNQIRSAKTSLRGVNTEDQQGFEYSNGGSLAEFDYEYKQIFHNLPLSIAKLEPSDIDGTKGWHYLSNDRVYDNGIQMVINRAPFSSNKLYYKPADTFFGKYSYPTAIHPIQSIYDGVNCYTDRNISTIPALTSWLETQLANLITLLQMNLNMSIHQCRTIANSFTYHGIKNQAIFESDYSFDDFFGVVGDVFAFDNNSKWLPYWQEINILEDGGDAEETFYFIPTTCILMERAMNIEARTYHCKFLIFQDQYTEE